MLEGLRTVLSDSSCARNYTGVRLRNRICVFVRAELVCCGGGVVGHVSGHVGCGLVRCVEAELFLEGTGGFGHLVIVFRKIVCWVLKGRTLEVNYIWVGRMDVWWLCASSTSRMLN